MLNLMLARLIDDNVKLALLLGIFKVNCRRDYSFLHCFHSVNGFNGAGRSQPGGRSWTWCR